MTKEREEYLTKRYNSIVRKCYRDMCGGLSFGMDWTTLRVLYPDRYSELKRIQWELDQ